METRDDAAGPFRYQILQLAKLHARPHVIYASSKTDAELLELLRSPVDPTAAAPQQFDVRVEKSSLFMPDKVCAGCWLPGLGWRGGALHSPPALKSHSDCFILQPRCWLQLCT
jgi:hypothetical protein